MLARRITLGGCVSWSQRAAAVTTTFTDVDGTIGCAKRNHDMTSARMMACPNPLFQPKQQQRALSSSSSSSSSPIKVIFLNAARLDYDQQLDWSRLQTVCGGADNLILGSKDIVTDPDEILQMVVENSSTTTTTTTTTVVITKEMTIPSHVFNQFPLSVQLLCEAGTGYNNLPIQLARTQRNIPVCNVPTYSTQAVAHMAITYLLNFSVSMLEQQAMLQRNDRSNFTGPFTLPLHEINDKTIALIGGAGRIGTKVAEIALALGMHVKITRFWSFNGVCKLT